MQTSKIVFAFLVVYAASLRAESLTRRSEKHCKSSDNCNPNPCLNGGTCDESRSRTGTSKSRTGTFKSRKGPKYTCTCPKGFAGEICEVNVCDRHDCQNGNCEADHCIKRGYKCNCFPGYFGNNCEVNVCDSNDCQNGGTCVADQFSARGYTCNCTIGSFGENCQVNVCDNNDCQNGGTCVADQSSARGYTCNCTIGSFGENCQVLPVDCKDIRESDQNNSGVYNIYLNGNISNPVQVYCDMETLDGGWTVIQKRVDGSVGFDRIWTDYKNGFGVPDQEVWIGNDVIHQLTKGNDSSLYVSITQVDGTTLFELYGRFSVSDEAENYQLFMDGPAIGTLGDRMLNVSSGDTLSGMFFTTPDRDNDRNPVGSCAVRNRGGWWFNYCHDAYFNGPWGSTIWSQPWFPLIVDGRDVRGTLMMVKRV